MAYIAQGIVLVAITPDFWRAAPAKLPEPLDGAKVIPFRLRMARLRLLEGQISSSRSMRNVWDTLPSTGARAPTEVLKLVSRSRFTGT